MKLKMTSAEITYEMDKAQDFIYLFLQILIFYAGTEKYRYQQQWVA